MTKHMRLRSSYQKNSLFSSLQSTNTPDMSLLLFLFSLNVSAVDSLPCCYLHIYFFLRYTVHERAFVFQGQLFVVDDTQAKGEHLR